MSNLTRISNGKIEGKKIQKISRSNVLIFQHNKLVEASYNLTLQEKRIILWLISKIKPDDCDFKKHSLHIREFQELIGAKSQGQGYYKEIKKITLDLIKKDLTIYDVNKQREIQVTWLNSAIYEENSGIVALSLSSDLTPYLLKLKDQFTAVSVENVMKFTSYYAIRFYEYFKQYEMIGIRTIEIDTIRKFCGVENKLKNYEDLKQRAILPAIKQINDRSDLFVTFEQVKESRKVKAINFKIETNLKNHKAIMYEDKNPSLYLELEKLGFSDKMISTLLAKHPNQEIINAVTCTKIQVARGNAKVPKALFRQLLKIKADPNIYTLISN